MIKLIDKKASVAIELTLENMAQLILDVKQVLNEEDFSERVSGLFSSGCTITLVTDGMFRIDQMYGLASRRYVLVHKISLMQLLKLEIIFLSMAMYYDQLASTYIKLFRKYVALTTKAIDEKKICRRIEK